MLYRTKLQRQTYDMYTKNPHFIFDPIMGDLKTNDLLTMLASFREYTIREIRDAVIAFRLLQLVWDAGSEGEFVSGTSLRALLCYFLSAPDIENPASISLTPDGNFIARWNDKYSYMAAEFMPDYEIKWMASTDHIEYVTDPLMPDDSGIVLDGGRFAKRNASRMQNH